MPGVVKEVECSIEDFSDQDLVSEIEWRGLEDQFVHETFVTDFSDDSLIDEIESRGYRVIGQSKDSISNLYTTYLTMSPEFFQKELIKFFKDNI